MLLTVICVLLFTLITNVRKNTEPFTPDSSFIPIIAFMNTVRKFRRGVMNHCYQRSQKGFVIFYTASDYLVYFTHYCICAEKYGIQVHSLCQMPDHVHDSVTAKSAEDLASFKRDVNASFARAQNPVCAYTGPLFEKTYGSAPKYSEKDQRSNIIYIANNPVERRLSAVAESYRWNYLAYASNPNPFSRKLVLRECRWYLRNAIKEVAECRRNGLALSYARLKRLTLNLTVPEKKQLADYIITTYNVIDYNSAITLFGTYDSMLTAIHSTTGSEHDIKERFSGKSDSDYAMMHQLLLNYTGANNIHDILGYDHETKMDLYFFLRQNCPSATSLQIAKYLRMEQEIRQFDTKRFGR